MGSSSETTAINTLDESTCWRLLKAHRVGRLVVAVGSQPDIFPVNFVIDDGDIVVRTAEGTKLAAAVMGGRVAFEIDDFDANARSGWSVVVHGIAHEAQGLLDVLHDGEIETSPWADGAKERVLRITPDDITGRSLGGSAKDASTEGAADD